MQADSKKVYVIQILYATLTRITEAMQDPFCIIELDNQKFQTSVIKDTPTKPIWEETFILVRTDKFKMKVSVWDYDSPTKSDLIGEGECDLKTLKIDQKKTILVDIFIKAKKAGVVFIDALYKIDEPKDQKEAILKEKTPQKMVKKKFMNNDCVLSMNKDFDIIIHNFEKIDLDQFLTEANVRSAVYEGLLALGNAKPKNPLNFLGNFLLNYK